ncbi:unnamed protein product [Oikopleura dioica]|uniref:LITAF domain-containing protein n=1 Tax=Oikopleura dioica TaxID=34765 RepID=E4YKX5_OIKDI|nr:unnamed protein product [Oikopleura dioica]
MGAPPAYGDVYGQQPTGPPVAGGPAAFQPAFAPGYAPQPAPQIQQPCFGTAPTTVIIQQQGAPTIINQRFGNQPQHCICPHCQHQGVSKTHHESGLGTWLAAGGICLFGCWLGCCLVPFCLNDLQDTVHKCENCRKVIRVKKLIS